MKILLVCKSLPPRVCGGVQSHTDNLSRELLNRGHEVHLLIAGSYRRPEHRYDDAGRTIIEIPYLPGRRLGGAPGVWAEEWAFNRAAFNWLKTHKDTYDLIHLQGRSGFMFPGHQGKTPLLVTFHGILGIENRLGGKTGFFHRMHQRWAARYERKAINQADACIAVSDEMLREMEDLQPDARKKTVIVSNGVYIPELPDNQPEHSNILLFVGRIERIKGIYPLLNAVEHLHPDIKIHLMGDGSEFENLKQEIRHKKLENRVILLGAQPAGQVALGLQKCFALAVPSFHETQGIVALEAGAYARPVVASCVGGLPEIVDHEINGFLVLPDDPIQLADRINTLYLNPNLASKMGKAGRKLVEADFSWEKVALETERVYGSVLAGKQYKSILCTNGEYSGEYRQPVNPLWLSRLLR